MEKMTNVKALEMVLGLEVVIANTELFEKLTKMKVQFERKNSSTNKDGSKTLSAEQKKNLVIKDRIYKDMLTLEEGIQITLFAKTFGYEESTQKLSALFKQMVEDNRLERIVEKKVTTFKAIKQVTTLSIVE